MIKRFLIALFALFVISVQANAVNYFDIMNNALDTVNQINTYTNQTRGGNYNQVQPVNYNNNSYERTPDRQNYDAPQYNEPQIPQGRTYAQNQPSFQGQARTLKELPAGTLVLDPDSVWNFRNGRNYSGEINLKHPVFWRILEHDHYTQGSTLLLSEFIVAYYDFCHTQKGLRAWNESDVRRFLRTTFYNHLSLGFQNAIVNVNIPFADLTGKPTSIIDNLFLLSIVEWGASDRANNGRAIKYDDMPNIYGGRKLRFVDSWNQYDIDSSWGSTTRTINRPVASGAGYNSDVFEIKSDGTLGTGYVLSDDVRPAVNLKSTTKVKGPYQFPYYINGQKKLTYYELDFSN